MKTLLLLIVFALLVNSTEADKHLTEEEYNQVGFVATALWAGWIFRTLAICLQIPMDISYVGVFIVGFIISMLDFNNWIQLKMIESFNDFDEYFFSVLTIPAILINLALRIDIYLYQRRPLMAMLVVISSYFYQFALLAISAYLINLSLLDIASERDLTLFITFSSIILNTKETKATMKLTRNCTKDLRFVKIVLHVEELFTVLTALHMFQVLQLMIDDEAVFKFDWKIVMSGAASVFAGAAGYLILTRAMILARYDTYSQICFLIGINYTIYTGLYAFFGNGGEIAIVLLNIILVGDLISKSKMKVKQLREHWMLVDYINHCVIFMMAGAISARQSIPTLGLMFLIACILFLVLLVSRYLFCLLFYTAISTGTAYKSTSDILVATIGAYKTGPPIVMALLLDLKLTNIKILPIVSFVVILTLLLQLLPFQRYLRLMQYYRLDADDIKHMDSLWQKLYQYRNRAIQYFTQTELTRAANTSFLKEFLHFGTPKDTIDIGLVNYELSNEDQLNDLKEDKQFHSFQNRILSIQLNFFKKRYEEGLLMMTGYKTLKEEIINARCREQKVLEIKYVSRKWDTLTIFHKLKKVLEKFLFYFPHYLKHPPHIIKTKFHAILYNIISTPLYQLIVAIITLCDVIAIAYIIINYYHNEDYISTSFMYDLVIINMFSYFLFNIEIFLEIYIFGTIYYFNKKSRILQFSQQTVIRTIETVLCLIDKEFPNLKKAKDMIIYLKMIIFFEVWRVHIIIPVIILKFTSWVTARANSELTKRADICNALIMSYDLLTNESLKSIKITASKLKKFKEEISKYKLEAIERLAEMNKENAYISTTLQTRQGVRTVLNDMYRVFLEEKLTGSYGPKELQRFENQFASLRILANDINFVTPEPAIEFLRNIKWLRENFIALFKKNALFYHFNYNEYIIKRGTDPNGLYIIVSGLVQMEYRPTVATLMRLVVHGQLPNCDHLASLDFHRPQETILRRGSLLGELGIVTGRRNDMNVKCVTFVEAYHISARLLMRMFHDADYSDVINGEIWASIGCQWAEFFLMKIAPYSTWKPERLKQFIERGISIILSPGTPLKLTYFLAEVILIEGVILDTLTKLAYYAPYRLDIKTVRNLIVGINIIKYTDENTRIYIIPKETAEKEDLFVEGLNTYRDDYLYDYEEVRHMVGMEAERFKTYQDENLISAIKRVDSSLVDINMSECLLSSKEETVHPPVLKEDKAMKEVILKDILTQKSERDFKRELKKGISSKENICTVIAVDEVRPSSKSSSEVSLLETPASKVEDSIKVQWQKDEKRPTSEETSDLIRKSLRFQPDLMKGRDISATDIQPMAATNISKQEAMFARGTTIKARVSPFLFPAPNMLTDVSLESIQSLDSNNQEEKLEDDDSDLIQSQESMSEVLETSSILEVDSQLEQEYYDDLFKFFPVFEQIMEKSLVDWRVALLPKEFHKNEFVQTVLQTMRKPNDIKVMFEQSLNSLLSETVLHPARGRRFLTAEDKLLKGDYSSEIQVRMRQYENLQEREAQFREKYKMVYQERDKQNVEIITDDIFKESKMKESAVIQVDSDEVHVERTPAYLTLKNLGQEMPEEFRSKYDIVEESGFGDSLSSYSRLNLGAKKVKGVTRKRRPVHQRVVCVKQRTKCPYCTRKYIRSRFAKLMPRIFKTGFWEDFLETISPKQYGIQRKKEVYSFLAPPELYSRLAAARFPRLPTPEDSYVKKKKEDRVYWSSSTSSS